MSFKTVLDKIGSDAKGVLMFFGSARGQAILKPVETGAVLAAGAFGGPAATTVVSDAINLFNVWGAEVLKTQALAQAAGAGQGSGPLKAAMVISTVAPQALQFAQTHGLPNPTAEQLQLANDAIVAFFNAWGMPKDVPADQNSAQQPPATATQPSVQAAKTLGS